MVRQLAIAAGLTITAAGSPDAKDTGALARPLDAQPLTDLRAAIATAPGGLVLIADPGTFASGRPGASGSGPNASARNDARSDAEELDAARDRGLKIASLVPLPASLSTLAQVGAPIVGARSGTLGLWCELLGLARLAPRFRELTELVEHFGPVQSVQVTMMASAACGGLGARLIDALDLCAALLGEPESVWAAHAGAEGGLSERHIATPVPEALSDLHGELALALRYEHARCASVLCSDRGGRYGLSVTAVGPRGRVTMTDHALLWLGPDGRSVDDPARQEPAPPPLGTPPQQSSVIQSSAPLSLAPPSTPFAGITPEALFVTLAGRQLRDYLASGVGSSQQLDYVRLLSCAQAALLSARTGQPQSPATMKRLGGLS